MKKKLFVFIGLLCLVILSSCTKNEVVDNPIVTMNIKDYGEIKIELYPNIAYNTVANFVTLIEDGFYDNNTFHRLAKEFVLQGGDPTATGTGGPGYNIKGEFALNGYTNNLSHTEGIVSMARGDDYNSAGSQFFIMLSDKYKTSLDYKYAAFGKIIVGMDIIKQIENANLTYKEGSTELLKDPLIIESATVDTKGHNYKVEKETR